MEKNHVMTKEQDEFVREYFMQTRREIDTVKRQRDLIVNFAIIVFGAVSFGVINSKEARDFMKEEQEGGGDGNWKIYCF
jgi:hypothetical protein